MSAQQATQQYFTIDEYLEREKTALVKSEYYKGEIFEMADHKPLEMAGGTPRHSEIGGNIYFAARKRLQGSSCKIFNSDLKVHIPENQFFTYPDITIACGQREYFKDSALMNPRVIIEVLSDSTEAYDRGTKFTLYRSIPSLQEYALVSQQEHLVEIFRRNQHGRWELYIFSNDAEVELSSVECVISMQEIYADLDEI
ncbi:MAG: Uma2 family endonuclease [Candidatus Kapaibacterium sp.]|nr:MAG: Uma2 family endonuclease [Candidatus Kapabacteria bacterium]